MTTGRACTHAHTKRAHAHTHTQNAHMHTRTHKTRTCTHAHTKRARAHTHTQNAHMHTRTHKTRTCAQCAGACDPAPPLDEGPPHPQPAAGVLRCTHRGAAGQCRQRNISAGAAAQPGEGGAQARRSRAVPSSRHAPQACFRWQRMAQAGSLSVVHSVHCIVA